MKSYFVFLKRNLAYALINLAGLALSMMFIVLIGAYAWQEHHIDSQHSKADRTYVISISGEGETYTGGHWRMIEKLKERFPEVEKATAMSVNRGKFEFNGEKVETNYYYVDPDFFDIFDFKLERGDRATVFDDPNSVVITEAYGRRLFGDADPMGRQIIYNRDSVTLTVTGIIEPMRNTALIGADRKPIDALVRFELMRFGNTSQYDTHMSNATGSDIYLLLPKGIDPVERAAAYEECLKESYWLLNLKGREYHLGLVPFRDLYLSTVNSGSSDGNRIQGNPVMLRILTLIGLAILLFALMNYVNLTVALSSFRAKEMATRRLLGDSRLKIGLRLMGESAIFCLVSFGIGLGLAFIFCPAFSTLIGSDIWLGEAINIATIAIIAGILLVLVVLSGLFPAIILSASKPIDVVRGTFRRVSKMVLGKIFIVVQNVVTIVMIASAVTIYLQVRHLVTAPLGYETDHRLVIDKNMDEAGPFVEQIKALPCVEKVSLGCGTPMDRGNNYTMTKDDRTVSFQSFIGDQNWLPIWGIEIERDNQVADAQGVFLNDQAFRELGITEDTPDFELYTQKMPIRGKVSTFHIGNILQEQHPVMVNIVNTLRWPWSITVKVTGDEKEAYQAIQNVYREVTGMDSFDARYVDQWITDDFRALSQLSKIIAIFGILAIIISMLGLSAISFYYVEQRRRDIAVRKVLGSTPSAVMRGIVREFLVYIVVAFAIALPIIYWLMHGWLAEYSYRINLDWWIYAFAGALAMLIGYLAVWARTRGAVNSNPVLALQSNQ